MHIAASLLVIIGAFLAGCANREESVLLHTVGPEECIAYGDGSSLTPPLIGDYLTHHPGRAVQECRYREATARVDYLVASPVVRSSLGVCSYKESMLSSDELRMADASSQDAEINLQFFAVETPCPPQFDPAYFHSKLVSDEVIFEAGRYWRDIVSLSSRFDTAFANANCGGDGNLARLRNAIFEKDKAFRIVSMQTPARERPGSALVSIQHGDPQFSGPELLAQIDTGPGGPKITFCRLIGFH